MAIIGGKWRKGGGFVPKRSILFHFSDPIGVYWVKNGVCDELGGHGGVSLL
jgi:hypothetical protein